MATIHDIAAKAGVSVAAVSYAFNGVEKISEKTRQRIFAVAREYRYKPRTLPNKTTTIAVVNGEVLNTHAPYDAMMLAALAAALARRQALMDVISVGNLKVMDLSIFNGAIAVLYHQGMAEEFRGAWGDRPTVFINWSENEADNYVGSPLDCGFDKAIAYLAERGHRRIGFVRNGAGGLSTQYRSLAYEKAVVGFGLDKDPALTRDVGKDFSSYDEAVAELLKARPTAILGDGEYLGPILARALRRLGKRIPDDVSLMPYENAFYSAYADPPHTTIAQNYAVIADTAIDKLFAMIGDEIADPIREFVPCDIIERESIKTIVG